MIWADLVRFAVITAVVHGAHMNVLLIVVDDMRPQLGLYGVERDAAYTPNMDRFGQSALVFDNAYCQIAICAPSRNSFMSGRRPDTTKCWNFINDFRNGPGANWTAMPQYFKEHGYFTSGAGKVFHPNLPPHFDYPKSWSEPFINISPGKCPDNKTWCAVPKGQFNEEHSDIADAKLVLAKLRNQSQQPNPFFLAAGFHKPHLPFRFPEEYLKYFPDPAKVPLPENPQYPQDGVDVAWHQCLGSNGGNWGEFPDMQYPLTRHQNLPDDTMRLLRRGYFSAITYTDNNIGQLLDAVDELGLYNSTIVVIFADHGWNLGEHSEYCKMTNWETGTRVPLMIRHPHLTASHGKHTNSPAELVDLYKTLAELAGLPAPEASVEGKSLAPLLRDPSQLLPGVALSQFPRCYSYVNVTKNWEDRHLHDFAEDCQWTNRTHFDIMGYSMRTNEYRLTQWLQWDKENLVAMWDQVNATELYLHNQSTIETTFNDENINLAYNPSYAETVQALTKQMKTAFGY